MKGQKKDESELVTKFVGIIVNNYFHKKISLKFLVKSLLKSFFTDHLKQKNVNKTTCRTPSSNPRQLCAHYLKSFPTAKIIFRGFQNFLIM